MSSAKSIGKLSAERVTRRCFAFGLASSVAAATAPCAATRATAQGATFPSRPIKIVFPYAAGGGPESILRLVAKKLEELYKAVIVIENRPGAGGTIGAASVKNSQPDGYTLLQGDHATHGANVALFKRLPYDAVADFQPITRLFVSRTFLVVPSALGINSVKELHQLAKAKPGGLTYASPGVGSGGYLGGAMLAEAFGVPMTHVPFRGTAAVRTEVLAGRVDFAFNTLLQFRGDIAAGVVKALAVAYPERLASAPDIPTFAETGYPSVKHESWFGLFSPAGTDTEIVDKLNAMFSKAANAPDVRDIAAKQDFLIRTTSRQEFAEFINEQIAMMARLVKDVKIDAP